MRITELVIACFNIDGMLAFYKNVFSISFEAVKISQGSIYVGYIDKIQITLCPANIAGIKATDNRHQLTFSLNDINNALNKTKDYNGSIMQELEEVKDFIHASIRDVDGNSIILKQKK